MDEKGHEEEVKVTGGRRRHTLEPSQYLLIHGMQKLWPHGVDEGLVNTSRHMEHWNCSSERKLPYNDILWEAEDRGQHIFERAYTEKQNTVAEQCRNNLCKSLGKSLLGLVISTYVVVN